LNPNIPTKKILIVDDQGFNIDALMIILKYSIKLKDPNQICDCVYDGKQALELVTQDVVHNNLSSCSYDLILMDCNMPVMDGCEATARIRLYLQELKVKQPMIVAVTGHSEDAYIQKAQDSGMNKVLIKPIEP
jgi:CheY-like chemotaxis protein